MKHPIALSGSVPGLKETLLAFIEQLRDTQCEAAEKELATVDFGEKITVQVELLASGGLNAIPRITVSNSGQQVERNASPAVTETTVAGEETSTESAEPSTTSDEAEKKHTQYTVNGTGGSDTMTTDQTIEAG